MALTVEDAITAIVNQANTLADTSTAEDLVYLAKSLEAVSDSTQAADTAIQTVVNKAEALGANATPEDLIYLAKAVEALALGSTLADVTAEGNLQVNRTLTEGDTQHDRVLAEGNTQHDRVLAEGNTQVTRTVDSGDQQTARVGASIFAVELRDVTLEYDSLDRLIKSTETLTDGKQRVTELAYNDSDQISQATITFDAETWIEAYTYDSSGNISTISVTQETTV